MYTADAGTASSRSCCCAAANKQAICAGRALVAQLVGLAVNPLEVAAARLSLVAQVGAHSGRMWDTLPIGMNSHLKVYFIWNCALMPRPEELKKRTDSKRKKYANLERAFKHSPLSRIYYDEPRTQSDKTRLAVGLSVA